MTILRKTVLAVLLASLVTAVSPVVAEAPPSGQTAAPTDAQLRDLDERLKSLQHQLDELNVAKDPASRRRLMQQNWQGMQDYMGGMHDRWGMGSAWMRGPGRMRGSGSSSWMMGCPMLGGNGAGWPLPKGVDPNQYSQQMREHVQRMQEQMNQIMQTTEPQERQRLLQEHWLTMYQDMQTMRGMGWMWDGYMMGPGMMGGRPLPDSKPLPDADSKGAKLVATYCVQCHAAPQPGLHTAAEWTSVTQRMHARMASGLQGIEVPTGQQMKTILAYMQKHAR